MRSKDENKEFAIRDTAIEMIVKEGFHGLSMQKLARAANISPSTIYVYFDSREDMLNKLFFYVDNIFTNESLKHFDPKMGFEQGLWLQWKNRYRHILKHPLHFHFSEQFRNSPLIKHKDIKDTRFKRTMKEFVHHAVQRKEIEDLPVEIFWALAYGPFYTLVKFHLDESSMAGKPFSLSDHKMKQAFALVMKALKK
jgi:TetR/AcrR family transcriptional regulator, multidrug resistance operon repressor